MGVKIKKKKIIVFYKKKIYFFNKIKKDSLIKKITLKNFKLTIQLLIKLKKPENGEHINLKYSQVQLRNLKLMWNYKEKREKKK